MIQRSEELAIHCQNSTPFNSFWTCYNALNRGRCPLCRKHVPRPSFHCEYSENSDQMIGSELSFAAKSLDKENVGDLRRHVTRGD